MAGATIIEDGRAADTPAPAAATGDPPRRPGGNALLWIVAGAFLILLAAWGTLIVIASRHPVTPVTIAAPGGGRR